MVVVVVVLTQALQQSVKPMDASDKIRKIFIRKIFNFYSGKSQCSEVDT